MSASTQEQAKVVTKAIQQIGQIATLPEITVKIIELVEDPDATASDLHRIIEFDPALCSRVLKVVNSSFYGLPGQIGSINRAIVLLGLNAVKNIAISASLAKLFRGGNICAAFSAKDLWTHSTATAATSKLLADELGMSCADEAFLAGLMHDIGIIVELQFNREALTDTINTIAGADGVPTRDMLESRRRTSAPRTRSSARRCARSGSSRRPSPSPPGRTTTRWPSRRNRGRSRCSFIRRTKSRRPSRAAGSVWTSWTRRSTNRSSRRSSSRPKPSRRSSRMSPSTSRTSKRCFPDTRPKRRTLTEEGGCAARGTPAGVGNQQDSLSPPRAARLPEAPRSVFVSAPPMQLIPASSRARLPFGFADSFEIRFLKRAVVHGRCSAPRLSLVSGCCCGDTAAHALGTRPPVRRACQGRSCSWCVRSKRRGVTVIFRSMIALTSVPASALRKSSPCPDAQ